MSFIHPSQRRRGSEKRREHQSLRMNPCFKLVPTFFSSSSLPRSFLSGAAASVTKKRVFFYYPNNAEWLWQRGNDFLLQPSIFSFQKILRGKNQATLPVWMCQAEYIYYSILRIHADLSSYTRFMLYASVAGMEADTHTYPNQKCEGNISFSISRLPKILFLTALCVPLYQYMTFEAIEALILVPEEYCSCCFESKVSSILKLTAALPDTYVLLHSSKPFISAGTA